MNSELPLIQKILATNYTYKQQNCFDVCFLDYNINKCGCQDLRQIVSYKDIPGCLNSTQIFCTQNSFANFYAKLTTDPCASTCPFQCDNIEYSASVTTTSFPTPAYYQVLKSHPNVLNYFGNDASAVSYEKLKAAVLHINIYYDTLSYTEITESAQLTIIDMVCNLIYFFFNEEISLKL
jgi:hypothetical protein